MSALEAILLGVVQGITEFLPVSSTGHLVAAQRLLGIEQRGLLLEVALHVGTLVAVLLVFRREIWQLARHGAIGLCLVAGRRAGQWRERAPLFPTALAVVTGSLPAACAGLLVEACVQDRWMEAHILTLRVSGVCLTITGAFLLASRWAPPVTSDRVGPVRGLLVGAAQAAALLPGISRSGSTIVAARFLGIEREVAGRFSFLLAVPAMVGAAVLKGRDLIATGNETRPALDATALGAAVAFIVGTVSLVLLMRVVRRGKLYWFASYCLPVGLLWILRSFA